MPDGLGYKNDVHVIMSSAYPVVYSFTLALLSIISLGMSAT